RGHHDRVDALLVEHVVEVFVEAGAGEALADRGGAVGVHVAQGDDVLVGDVVEVVRALPGDADDADADAVVGGRPGVGGLGVGQGGGGGGGDAGLQETTAAQAGAHGVASPW